MRPTLSVVIPTYNLRFSLELVLRCLEAQTYSPYLFECIIVDDKSTDGTEEYLKSRQSPLQLIKLTNPTNLGRGATRNIGWQHASGNIVIFLDGDTLPDADWLSDLARAFETHKCEVISGARYCININPKQNDLPQQLASLIDIPVQDIFAGDVKSQFKMLHAHAEMGAYRKDVFQRWELQLRELCQFCPDSLISAYTLSGTNVALRRELLQATGGFSALLRRGEDTDLGIRIWELGGRFAYAEGANSYHQADSTEANRGLTPIESAAFFHRHPYQEVLLVYLWFLLSLSRENDTPELNLLGLVRGFRKAGQIPCEWLDTLNRVVPTDCRYSKEELANYFCEVAAIPAELINSYIDNAIHRGVYVVRARSGVKFDIPITSRWLREHTPLHEYTLVNASYARNQEFLFRKDCPRKETVSLNCKGVYEIFIAAKVLDGIPLDAILNIPLPCEDAGQSALRFTSCWPPNLLDFANYKIGMIARYPWSSDQPEVHISYEFSCELHELGQHKPDDNDNTQILRTYLRPNLLLRNYVKARSIVARVRCAETDPYEVANNIYHWILDNTSFHNGLSPEYDIVETGLGTCIDQSRLFVSLCRLAGIPARERCGALLARRIDTGDLEEVLETTAFYHSPFSHTWAEFYIQDSGWIPVEFIGWLFGRRGMTALNIVNPRCRATILANTTLYDSYYFGTVDPYRVHCGDQANRMQLDVTCLGSQSRHSIQRLCERIRHRLTCTLKRHI